MPRLAFEEALWSMSYPAEMELSSLMSSSPEGWGMYVGKEHRKTTWCKTWRFLGWLVRNGSFILRTALDLWTHCCLWNVITQSHRCSLSVKMLKYGPGVPAQPLWKWSAHLLFRRCHKVCPNTLVLQTDCVLLRREILLGDVCLRVPVKPTSTVLSQVQLWSFVLTLIQGRRSGLPFSNWQFGSVFGKQDLFFC